MKILLIEEDRALAGSLQAFLKRSNFEVDAVHDEEDGVAYGRTAIYDFIVLNAKISQWGGYRITRYLRMYMITTPIIMVSEKTAVGDRIESLNAGADYFLAAPLDPQELLAVLKAMIRRQGGQQSILQFGNTKLDLTGYTLYTAAGESHLSAKEFDIMRLLMQYQGRSIRKDDILTRVWGYDSDAAENSVDTYITFLRRKLRAIGSDVIIKNIRLLGYHLEAPQSPPNKI